MKIMFCFCFVLSLLVHTWLQRELLHPADNRHLSTMSHFFFWYTHTLLSLFSSAAVVVVVVAIIIGVIPTAVATIAFIISLLYTCFAD